MAADIPKDDEKSSGLKSVGSKKPLRSRGFLSQPGGSVKAPSDDSGDQPVHHRSRGARQVSPSSNGRPQDLSVKPVIKPYRLEDK
ncbi:hypothetical protein [Roseibium aggregatum]|uniref:hypothetical protein n=1 Tax=Roseibium aggregatum TaxID=187304 RepID=UPI003A96D70F